MHFKYPEILYALFLLIIPILVHLFQFRRFKKVPFTNVAFLKTVVQETRKSSKLKKWLILALRLLAFTAIILAFSQPYLISSESAVRPRETVIFLDNSFSMQAKGTKGPLLEQAIQEMIANPSTESIHLFTHNSVLRNLDLQTDRNSIIDLTYASVPLTPEAIRAKGENLFQEDLSHVRQFIIISDFQDFSTREFDDLTDIETYFVQLRPSNLENLNIESMQVYRTNRDFELQVTVESTSPRDDAVPLSLYNGERLIAKATANFEENTATQTSFNFPAGQKIEGRLTLTDPNILFDNSLYFVINEQPPLNILSINESSDEFLRRLFAQPEYRYDAIQANQMDFSLFVENDVVILNELRRISAALINALQTFTTNGGKIILIPSEDSSANGYDELLQSYGLSPYGERITSDKMVTSINYDHPYYAGVFGERRSNFEYPSINSFYPYSAVDVMLSLEDGSPFLAYNNGLFLFSAPLNTSNSNFQDSPLIVPTFDVMAKQALSLPEIYYTIGNTNQFDIKLNDSGNEVIKLEKDGREVIPLQERQGDRITLFTNEGIEEDGIYSVKHNQEVISEVAYNYNREESRLTPVNIEEDSSYASVDDLLNTLTEATNLDALFKWFVIFAVMMLLLELLILKFIK